MSFIKSWVDQMSQYTAASKVYHRAAAYTAIGALLTQENYKCTLAVGTPRLWTNLYVVLVGTTATFKSTPISMVEQLLDGVDAAAGVRDGIKAGDDITPEGLLAYMERRSNTPTGPSVIMLQTEWVNLLMMMNRQYSAMLHPLLIQLYDVANDYKRNLVKKNLKLRYPRLSMLGAITPEKLAQYGESQDWEGGFFNRIVFLSALPERVQEDQPRIPQSAYDASITNLMDRMERWRVAREKLGWVFYDFDREAIKVGRGLYLGADNPELHDMLRRSQSHMTKIAAIEQWDEDPERPQIGVAAARRAREFIEAYQKGIPHIVTTSFARSRSDFEGDRLARSVLRYINANRQLPHGGPTRADILRQCGLEGRRVGEALTSLMDAGHIQSVAVDEETSVFCAIDPVQGEDVKPSLEKPTPVVIVDEPAKPPAEQPKPRRSTRYVTH